MTQNSTDLDRRAGEYAYIFRSRGWQIVPTIKRGNAMAPVFSGREYHERLVDDQTFDRWFGEDGTYRGALHIGVFTGPVSRNLHVFEVDTQRAAAMLWWDDFVKRCGIRTAEEFAVYTDDFYLRTFLSFLAGALPPRGQVWPGVTVLGKGDFVAIPVLTLEDLKRGEGVQ